MSKFAKDTDVSVAKSRNEIEGLIVRYGATSTAFMNGPDKSMVLFEANNRRICFTLPLPSRADREFTHARANATTFKARSADGAAAAWEQACRQRWRALALIIKAKLEAVESGITTFEDEFLAHTVMPDGMTVAEHVKPRIAEAYAGGKMLALMPPTRPNAPTPEQTK